MVKIIFDADEDWEKRTLCSDESCIGTIGSNGKCKECGKPYEGNFPVEDGVKNIRKVVVEEKKPVSSEVAEYDDDWDKRVLCSDEACIGVIGSDGKCKECGKLGSK